MSRVIQFLLKGFNPFKGGDMLRKGRFRARPVARVLLARMQEKVAPWSLSLDRTIKA